MISISLIILLPPTSEPSNLGRISDPHLMPESFQHIFEPPRVAACFNTDDHLAGELLVESSNIVLLVLKILLMDLSIVSFQPTDGLYTSVKINSAVYCHLAPPSAI